MTRPWAAALLLAAATATAGCRPSQASGRQPEPPRSRWVYPLPQGNHMRGVWVAASGDVVAVGAGGTTLRLIAREQRWVVREPTRQDLSAVWGDGKGHVYAGGSNGTLLVSRDGGTSFRPAASGTTAWIRALSGCGQEVFAVGSDWQLTRSADAGATWRPSRVTGAPAAAKTPALSFAQTAGDLTGVSCSADGRVTAIAFGGALLTSTDHGATWKRRDVSRAELGMVSARGADDLIGFVKLIRTDRELFITSERAAAARGPGFPTRDWVSVWRVRGDRVESWPVAERVSQAIDATSRGAPDGAVSLVVTRSGRAALVARSGGEYWAKPGDRLWRPSERDARVDAIGMQVEDMVDVAGDDQVLYGVGSWGSLFVSRDAGSHWLRMRPPVDHFQALWFDGQQALVGGFGVAQSRDGGRTWSTPRRVAAMNQSGIHSIWGAGAELFLAGDFGFLYSPDRGTTFAPVAMTADGADGGDGAGELRAWGVWGTRPDDLFVVGGLHEHHGASLAAVILRRSAAGLRVALKIPAPPLLAGVPRGFTCVHGDGAGHVYAGAINGIIYRSADGGLTWTKMPGLPVETDLVTLHAGTGQVVWALAERHAHSQRRLWLSRDGAQSFTPVQPPDSSLGEDISAIDGSPAGELVVAQQGRVYERDQATGTWTELTVGAHAASVQLVALAVPSPRHALAAGDMGTMILIAPGGDGER